MLAKPAAKSQFRESPSIQYNNRLHRANWFGDLQTGESLFPLPLGEGVSAARNRNSLTPALSEREREFFRKQPVSLIELQDKLRTGIRAAARELFDVDLEQIVSDVPPRTELGDLAFPVAFELAKQIKKKAGEKRAPR